jgi:hypothetical protein
MEKQQKKKTYKKQQEDKFDVQAAPAPGPSPSSSSEEGGNITPELAGTLVTAVSLRSRGGGGLRSIRGTTYLIGAAARLEGRCAWKRGGWIHGGERRRLT